MKLNNVNLMGARGVLELPGGQLNPEHGGGLSPTGPNEAVTEEEEERGNGSDPGYQTGAARVDAVTTTEGVDAHEEMNEGR